MAIKKFPAEFSELLTPAGMSILRGRDRKICPSLARSNKFFVSIPGALDKRKAEECLRLLDDNLYPLLQVVNAGIPPEAISGMKENYSELLPKTMRIKTAYLDSVRSRSYKVAKEIGLTDMMHSESFFKFAEAVTGFSLDSDLGSQVICYEQGHYVGPHNDHHPEDEFTKNGFIDLHLVLPNSAVDHQWVVYEERGHLSKIVDANVFGGINVYKLPFWHYVTPLVGKPGSEEMASRWLILGTFNFLRNS